MSFGVFFFGGRGGEFCFLILSRVLCYLRRRLRAMEISNREREREIWDLFIFFNKKRHLEWDLYVCMHVCMHVCIYDWYEESKVKNKMVYSTPIDIGIDIGIGIGIGLGIYIFATWKLYVFSFLFFFLFCSREEKVLLEMGRWIDFLCFLQVSSSLDGSG